MEIKGNGHGYYWPKYGSPIGADVEREVVADVAADLFSYIYANADPGSKRAWDL